MVRKILLETAWDNKNIMINYQARDISANKNMKATYAKNTNADGNFHTVDNTGILAKNIHSLARLQRNDKRRDPTSRGTGKKKQL